MNAMHKSASDLKLKNYAETLTICEAHTLPPIRLAYWAEIAGTAMVNSQNRGGGGGFFGKVRDYLVSLSNLNGSVKEASFIHFKTGTEEIFPVADVWEMTTAVANDEKEWLAEYLKECPPNHPSVAVAKPLFHLYRCAAGFLHLIQDTDFLMTSNNVEARKRIGAVVKNSDRNRD